jgi:CubicO group peptidase (beta-lactamase class C family)
VSALSRRTLLRRAAAAGLFAAAGQPGSAAVDDSLWARRRELFAQLLPERMAQLGVPGAQAVLLREGGPAWSVALGRRGPADTDAAVQADTVFEAASMSKPLFAYLVLLQVQAGRLGLDQPVMELLPQEVFTPAQDWQRLITPRMLLAHTSGLPNWRPGDSGPSERDGPLELLFRPGLRYEYSGEGYFYLQRVLEHLSGLPLQALAEQQLFKPLGMTGSSFVLTPSIRARRARGHDEAGQALPPSEYRHANAAYTLFSTASDYALFLADVLRATATDLAGSTPLLREPALRAELLAHQVAATTRQPIARPGTARGQSVFWGLGWGLDTSAQGDIAYHSGTNRTGFRCYSQFCPARGSGLVLMSNSLMGDRLWRQLVAVMGDL